MVLIKFVNLMEFIEFTELLGFIPFNSFKDFMVLRFSIVLSLFMKKQTSFHIFVAPMQQLVYIIEIRL